MLLSYKQKKWILIVDDEPEIRDKLSKYISTLGGETYKIVEAKDGVEATQKIQHQRFHCIITDIQMPKKEGESFITSVRHNSFNEFTPVIVLSGVAKSEIESRFAFVYFMPKPFDPKKLGDLIQKQLQVGSTKNKLSAGALNELVRVSSNFLEHICGKDSVNVGSPIQKNAGEKIENDFASVIEVKIGKVKNTFSIFCQENDLLFLKKKMGFENATHVKFYRSMTYVILKRLLASCEVGDPQKFVAQKMSTDNKFMDQKRGIIVPLEIETSRLFLFASAADSNP